MANTFTLISTTTVGAGGAASIDFTSIPQTYTDLCLFISARSTADDTVIYTRFNGSTSGYTTRRLTGNGSSAASDTVGTSFIYPVGSGATSYTSNTFGNASFYIPNYAGSTNKSVSVDGVTENNSTGNYMAILAGLWSNTSAITSITLQPGTGTSFSFAQYSTASLYGILKGSGGATVS